MTREVKKLGHVLGSPGGVARVREATLRLTKLVEERMDHGIDGRKTLGRGVLQQQRDQIDCVGAGLAEHLDACQYILYLTKARELPNQEV